MHANVQTDVFFSLFGRVKKKTANEMGKKCKRSGRKWQKRKHNLFDKNTGEYGVETNYNALRRPVYTFSSFECYVCWR